MIFHLTFNNGDEKFSELPGIFYKACQYELQIVGCIVREK
jgi:hypothetical protein